ncbi:ABC transporter ATP-binding protein [Lichenifustis flavocetrariae]|uniref:ABC transporter ATP-binding protein/permease n=1 Tax=Lichenifustis flavocetrariae TaxID=2949735 RepID=A0AA41YY20_9HYPH|nr:ABC transporter ATP-binding protein [Lichenifustis flavocetrariae]MCW6506998.1 ABC transporter ATP-binding protein/permease [Lichenifustis flavocetrariae]
MDEYADRPFAFFARYVQRRRLAHASILIAVLGAVTCSVSTQYGVKFLVDTLSRGPGNDSGPWTAFAVLVSFVACDNFLWRIASWIASFAFVSVTGDLRSDLFRYLTGHAPSYFADRLPGVLTSRITATSNAVFTIENMFVWNVLPPCVATVGAIAFLTVVSVKMAGFLVVVAGGVMFVMFRIAAAGKPLHHDFADKAAAVDGEMIDVIGNMNLVKAFGGVAREHNRFDVTVGRELLARRKSLQYLEKMRLLHAFVVVVMTLGLLAWAIRLWQAKEATAGDVVLVATLGLSVLSATRDLAVALVDVTQHLARLSEALKTLLTPYQMASHPDAMPLVASGARVTFDRVSFKYPSGRAIFEDLTIEIEPGQRVGLVGPSGGGKSTLISLLQRFYDVQGGRILIDGQDVSRITETSLRDAIAVVPQDTALLNRSLADNIRYGRPEASDEEVWNAAIAAKCRPFVENLPEGLETIVGDRGTKLSGGQRQRIAIARAFLKNAPILLLDEATSALDSESEEAIRQALERLMTHRTVLTVAHRLSTLRGFDRILVLRGGKVVQDGPPDELMQSEGPYRDLINEEVSRLAPQAA